MFRVRARGATQLRTLWAQEPHIPTRSLHPPSQKRSFLDKGPQEVSPWRRCLDEDVVPKDGAWMFRIPSSERQNISSRELSPGLAKFCCPVMRGAGALFGDNLRSSLCLGAACEAVAVPRVILYLCGAKATFLSRFG